MPDINWMNMVTQTNWSWCIKRQGLFYSGQNNGRFSEFAPPGDSTVPIQVRRTLFHLVTTSVFGRDAGCISNMEDWDIRFFLGTKFVTIHMFS